MLCSRPLHSRSIVHAQSAINVHLTKFFRALLAGSVITCVSSSVSSAQTSASDSPLHLAANRIDFSDSGDAKPPTKPFRIHNGGKTPFSDVRMTKVSYADSARGAAWLVVQPRQSSVAPDELATVATLCVDAAGLPAGTYRATAAVAAREVPDAVPFTVTLVVTESGALARHAGGRCLK